MFVGSKLIGEEKCFFSVWAPEKESIKVKITTQDDRIIDLKKDNMGYWTTTAHNIHIGDRYLYIINEDRQRADPASRSQPEGVHKASEIVDIFSSEDNWKGNKLEEYICYEIHIGTFTDEGTFKSAADKLEYLKELGVTAVEIMPVAQFPGDRNWGYDGVYPFAVQNSYGGVKGLKYFIEEAHKKGISVILDVVYNHQGPEGNYITNFAPYFTSKYKTPWGDAINYDDEYSYGVRNYYIENVLYWFDNLDIDALRLDAVHAIHDESSKSILKEISENVNELSEKKGKDFYLIAESDLNNTKTIDKDNNGDGMDAQWCDDFHHTLHVAFTGESEGYYKDFKFNKYDVEKAFNEGFVYDWRFSKNRKKYFGCSAKDYFASKFVVFSQNHDHVGNRAFGDRMSTLISFEAQKMCASSVIMSQYIPFLFMGEEYSETNPFLYFVSHGDKDLIEAVREGRKKEFEEFHSKEEAIDPQSEKTFNRSKLDWGKIQNPKNNAILEYYKELIRLRKELEVYKDFSKDNYKSEFNEKTLTFYKENGNERIIGIINMDAKVKEVQIRVKGKWRKILDSSSKKWMGKKEKAVYNFKDKSEIYLNGYNFVLYKSVGGE